VLEKREEELQKLVEGLEEEREKRINEFDESMAGLQRQVSYFLGLIWDLAAIALKWNFSSLF
jgi:hypothetical protein